MSPVESIVLQLGAMYACIGFFVLLASRHRISDSYGFAAFFVIVYRFFLWPFFAGWVLCEFMKRGDL